MTTKSIADSAQKMKSKQAAGGLAVDRPPRNRNIVKNFKSTFLSNNFNFKNHTIMSKNYFRINMPYVIEKVDEFGGEWVVMNRNYSPLGDSESVRLKWERFPQNYLRLKRITDGKINKLEKAGATIRRNEAGEATRIVLYNDASAPVDRWDVELNKSNWAKYCKLLEIIATLKVQ